MSILDRGKTRFAPLVLDGYSHLPDTSPPGENASDPALESENYPLMIHGKLYLYVPIDASLSPQGFALAGLPPVPVDLYLFTRSMSGRLIRFTDLSSAFAFAYAMEEPSEKKLVRFPQILRQLPHDSISWSLSDVWSPAPSFTVLPIDSLSQWNSKIRHGKGYGDESIVPLSQP